MGYRASVADEDLRADLEDELDWDPAVPAANIGVSVTDGLVTVSGTVHTLVDRLATLAAARRVGGVRAIVDEIEVVGADGEDETDAAVSARIEHRFRSSTSVPPSVTATVRAGVVTLAGIVQWRFEREAAEAAVQEVRGVGRVVNQIVVKPRATAQAVRSRIVAAYQRNAKLDASAIHVVAEGGTVWLSGRVHSLDARAEAESAAWSAPGVTVVNNAIAVG